MFKINDYVRLLDITILCPLTLIPSPTRGRQKLKCCLFLLHFPPTLVLCSELYFPSTLIRKVETSKSLLFPEYHDNFKSEINYNGLAPVHL